MKIELKKNYITSDEVDFLVTKVIEIYDEEKEKRGNVSANLEALNNFFHGLFSMCIEGYDMDKFDEYYNKGFQEELIKEVINARYAYNLINKLIDDRNSLEYLFNKNMNDLVEGILKAIPNAKSLMGALEKMPKEWANATNEYNKITGKGEDK